MKKTIKGIWCNTKTADKIQVWCSDNTCFKRHTETLYKTDAGDYFIHGCSGPMGPYAIQRVGALSELGSISVGTCWGPGEELFRISLEQANAWKYWRKD